MQNTESLKSRVTLRKIAVTGIMAAIATVLMMVEFPIPALIPSFVKLDFSELPALITGFCFGPVHGVAVCLIKNVIHLAFSATGGVGELANFLIGAPFVLIASLIYKRKKSRSGALIGSLIGAVITAAVSVPVNYFISYPVYTAFMDMSAIVAAYKAILPAADTLIKALLIFNAPFTLAKALIDAVITFLIYKKLSPLLKGKAQ
ncbi:MAG: ECF transporter S component [Firmicutes bacterium]|nr:ECF transporter S component [Bacillota bacterium]